MAIDLDKARAARREVENATPSFILDGKEYPLPVELPFSTLETLRGLNNEDTAIESLISFMKSLVGDNYDEVAPKLTLHDFRELVASIMRDYGVESPLASSAS